MTKLICISLIITYLFVVSIILVKQIIEKQNTQEEDIYIEPSSGVHTHTIIFIHGLATAPERYKPAITEHLNLTKVNTTKFVFLRAPVAKITCLGIKDLSWFDITSKPIDAFDKCNINDFKKSSERLKEAIDKEAEILGGKYDKIFIGGHSQGGCLVLYTAYSMEQMIGGVFSFSGFLFKETNILSGKEKLNVYFAYGDADDYILPKIFEESIEKIKNYEGFKKYVYPNHTHYVNRQERIDAGIFLNGIMQ